MGHIIHAFDNISKAISSKGGDFCKFEAFS